MSKEKKQQPDYSAVEAVLKQEIAISQEILSQLTQHEYLLLIGEVEMKQQLTEDLKTLKKQKNTLLKKRKTLTLEADPLDPAHICNEELLILLDKSHILTQKIKEQEERNKALSDIIKNEMALDPSNPALHPQMIYDSKGTKPLLITLDYHEEE